MASCAVDMADLGLRDEADVACPIRSLSSLWTHAGLQRAGRVGVAQIVEGDARESRGRGDLSLWELLYGNVFAEI
jgi:hypothetical protein